MKALYLRDSLLESFRTVPRMPNGFGIGLVNIHQRIQMLLGNPTDCPLRTRDEKAIAIITIPYKTEEDDYA